jgi:type II secretory pathway pseudopilin PulG
LLELLIVMAIIGILVALLFPVLGMVRSRTDSAKCITQLSQIGAAMSAYINDQDGMLPGPLSCEQSATYLPGQAGSLAALLENYLGTAGSVAPDGTSRYSPLFECPSAARLRRDLTKPTYIVNMLPAPEIGQAVWGDIGAAQKPLRSAALGNWNDASTGGTTLTVSQVWAVQDGDQNYAAQAPDAVSAPTSDLLPTAAHGDHYNDLFFDFHVASRTSLIAISAPTAAGGTPAPSAAPTAAPSPSP